MSALNSQTSVPPVTLKSDVIAPALGQATVASHTNASTVHDASRQWPKDRFDEGDAAKLLDAVRTGDADAAKQALADLQKLAEQTIYGVGSQSTNATAMQRDFQALVAAVNSSNMFAAKQALSRLQSLSGGIPGATSKQTGTTTLGSFVANAHSIGGTESHTADEVSKLSA